MKRVLNIISLIIFILLEESIFGVLTVGNIGNIILKALFCISLCFIIETITSIFNTRANKILFYVITGILTLMYIVHDIYYQLLGNILSITSLINGTQQATAFSSIAIQKIIANWKDVFLLLIPYILLCVLHKKLVFEKRTKKKIIINIILAVTTFLGGIAYINITSKEDEIYSSKNLYYSINNPIENVRKFGLCTTARLDIQRTIFGFEEKNLYTYQNEQGENKVINIDEYNITDIDFDKLIEEETDEEIKETYEYLKTQEPSNKNEYTGRFEGKNLIVFVAESFSNMAIREDITPTLYKMANDGFQFENFYTPLFPVSTADGEYLTDTSLLPAEGIWSIENVKGKTFPYTYANVLKNQGYTTYAYHNYEYDYYKRDEYFETMGYSKYLAQGNGLEKRMDFSEYPASDYEMVKNTIEDYINDEHFVAYYMTMSGHMNYDETNAMVKKNWDKVKDLPYSTKAKSYLATQIELDKALEELIERLEEAGKLEDTVIVITGDHYPYGLTLEEIQEISNEEIDVEFGRYHMPFILYNGAQEKGAEVEKYASSLDVLPTMLNLFGIEYDSRLLMGRDIFSNSNSLVIFSDRSYITDKGRYNSGSETFQANDENEEIEENYVQEIKKEIYHKYRYSRLILEHNIYQKLSKN